MMNKMFGISYAIHYTIRTATACNCEANDSKNLLSDENQKVQFTRHSYALQIVKESLNKSRRATQVSVKNRNSLEMALVYGFVLNRKFIC